MHLAQTSVRKNASFCINLLPKSVSKICQRIFRNITRRYQYLSGCSKNSRCCFAWYSHDRKSVRTTGKENCRHALLSSFAYIFRVLCSDCKTFWRRFIKYLGENHISISNFDDKKQFQKERNNDWKNNKTTETNITKNDRLNYLLCT